MLLVWNECIRLHPILIILNIYSFHCVYFNILVFLPMLNNSFHRIHLFRLSMNGLVENGTRSSKSTFLPPNSLDSDSQVRVGVDPIPTLLPRPFSNDSARARVSRSRPCLLVSIPETPGDRREETRRKEPDPGDVEVGARGREGWVMQMRQ